MFPIPSTGKINFVFKGDAKKINISLVDLRGITVFKASYSNIVSALSQSYDFSNLSKGIYIFKINTDDTNEIRRIVIN